MKKQSGSTHELILVVVGIVVILGVLGYVFWSNSIGQEKTQETSLTNGVALTEKTTLTLDGRTVSLNYPKDWTVKKQLADEAAQTDHESTMQIISPDKTYAVSLSLANGGFGGACPPGTIILDSSTTKLDNGTEEMLYDAIISDRSSDKAIYSPFTRIIPGDADMTKLANGKDGCYPLLTMQLFSADGKALSSTGTNPVMASASVVSTDTQSTTGDASLQAAKAARASDVYQTARQILLTVHG